MTNAYTFEAYSDIYKRTFVQSPISYWKPGDRPIYDRLPGLNAAYNKKLGQTYNEEGVIYLSGPNYATSGKGTLSLAIDRKNPTYLKIFNGTISWPDGETEIRDIIIGINNNNLEWDVTTYYTKGQVISHDSVLYTVQENYTSGFSITDDLNNSYLFRVAFPNENTSFYVWFELLKSNPDARFKDTIPENIIDVATVTASRSDSCHSPKNIFDNNNLTSWRPPGLNNVEDWVELQFDGLIRLDQFKLNGLFSSSPAAKVLYDGISVTDFVLVDSSGVWTFPVDPNLSASTLKIQFEDLVNPLEVTGYSFEGDFTYQGESSLRTLFAVPRVSFELDMEEIEVLGSCILGKINIENGKIVSIEDQRVLHKDLNTPVADWLTTYWDNNLINSRAKVENFIIDRLDPSTTGNNLYKEILGGGWQDLDDNLAEITKINHIITPFGV